MPPCPDGAAAERALPALRARSPFRRVRNGIRLHVAVAVQGLLRHVRRIDRQAVGIWRLFIGSVRLGRSWIGGHGSLNLAFGGRACHPRPGRGAEHRHHLAFR